MCMHDRDDRGEGPFSTNRTGKLLREIEPGQEIHGLKIPGLIPRSLIERQ